MQIIVKDIPYCPDETLLSKKILLSLKDNKKVIASFRGDVIDLEINDGNLARTILKKLGVHLQLQFVPNKNGQLRFLHRYEIVQFDDWEDVVIKTLYKKLDEVVPWWVDWLIQKTGYGYFVLHLLGVKVFSKREDEDYLVEIAGQSGTFRMAGGVYCS